MYGRSYLRSLATKTVPIPELPSTLYACGLIACLPTCKASSDFSRATLDAEEMALD
jgi:hypothetical protein